MIYPIATIYRRLSGKAANRQIVQSSQRTRNGEYLD